ncbi:alpha-2,8-sialyltransferase 8E [Callorhinchus milii]|uniref:Alpha2,8-sialyltransferase ST8Sia V n=1 Tax=Callorhinchus milii TaxID=7868 RepID=A3KLD7_CALMI|nr:alpha-2,8-sialyltransferase 8E [Callorhinchus milii]CAM35867.1 alpha2,8-sialyltransferase ST8Sia V [Callorhinchus milii]
MGYSERSGKDILGNRSLFFIFISAFAIVTLLQHILNGKNYIKRYFELTEGSYDYNSSTCRELRNDITEVKVLSMVKQSELFERWRTLQLCKWELNKTEANTARLTNCCNAIQNFTVTQVNTALGANLTYDAQPKKQITITEDIFNLLPQEMPYSRSQFKKCAVVGNGGILKKSECGKEINSADFVFSCNLPPLSNEYARDVGHRTQLVTANPSIIKKRFQKLDKWRRPFVELLQVYENTSVVMPAFYNTRNTDVSLRVRYALDDFSAPQDLFYFHPRYLENVARFWGRQGVRAKRPSSGLMLVTAAMELCQEVHLYGFWGFPMDPSGIHITHHYYDNVKPRPGFHSMPNEIFTFLHMHSRGVLQVHTTPCR